ncbi:hypothetical protein [Methylobacterium sp. 77]|uniref:hypothetical protein n=1 Tax=Methylobacterium sp. 77 TaxID=1101192 RepID=UPI001FD8F886|nr:hypothetical protein [Methylobacterium sp. 77]
MSSFEDRHLHLCGAAQEKQEGRDVLVEIDVARQADGEASVGENRTVEALDSRVNQIGAPADGIEGARRRCGIPSLYIPRARSGEDVSDGNQRLTLGL